MRLSVRGLHPRGCRAVSQVQQMRALPYPIGILSLQIALVSGGMKSEISVAM